MCRYRWKGEESREVVRGKCQHMAGDTREFKRGGRVYSA